MDVLERIKIDTGKANVTGECIKQARYYIKKRKPDIANQYTTLAEHVERAKTSREVSHYKVILDALNVINDLTGSN